MLHLDGLGQNVNQTFVSQVRPFFIADRVDSCLCSACFQDAIQLFGIYFVYINSADFLGGLLFGTYVGLVCFDAGGVECVAFTLEGKGVCYVILRE